MKEQLTEREKKKIFDLCFNDQSKACAIAQYFLDCLQPVGCSTYADVHKNKSKRTVLYQKKKMNGVDLDRRRFICLIQQ